MKIESYEPYHIGLKIYNYVDRETLIMKVYDYFEAKNDNDCVLNKDATSRDVYSPNLTILTYKKKKVKIQMNFIASALNVIGNEPENVITLFEELISIFPKMGYDIDSTISFYELVTFVILEIKEQPIEILKKFSIIDLSKIYNIPNVEINYIRFSNSFTPKKKEDHFQLEILPNPINPKNRIGFRIIKRFQVYEEIKSFCNELNDLLEVTYKTLIGD